jgi:hypothetical protein
LQNAGGAFGGAYVSNDSLMEYAIHDAALGRSAPEARKMRLRLFCVFP